MKAVEKNKASFTSLKCNQHNCTIKFICATCSVLLCYTCNLEHDNSHNVFCSDHLFTATKYYDILRSVLKNCDFLYAYRLNDILFYDIIQRFKYTFTSKHGLANVKSIVLVKGILLYYIVKEKDYEGEAALYRIDLCKPEKAPCFLLYLPSLITGGVNLTNVADKYIYITNTIYAYKYDIYKNKLFKVSKTTVYFEPVLPLHRYNLDLVNRIDSALILHNERYLFRFQFTRYANNGEACIANIDICDEEAG
eukprot:TRINITY_DN109860_c0_g1_i1.p1 TRINITY_DN109860_c0_g1~~TRINITY_DN109860_c0_g1_i1.p1  ORF type:complete len:251 (+),score=7.18 TRINITY_DN109860_c0_g1_i1:72-824(+)